MEKISIEMFSAPETTSVLGVRPPTDHRSLVEHHPDAVLRFDPSGVLTFANRAARALFENLEAHPVGPLAQLGFGARAQAMACELWAEGLAGRSGTRSLRRAAGRIELRGVPERGPTEEIEGVLIFARLVDRPSGRRRTVDRAKRRSGRLAALASAMSRALEPQLFGETVLQQSLSALGASGGAVYLVDEARARLELFTAEGELGPLVERFPVVPVDGPWPMCEVLRTGEMAWIDPREALARHCAESDFGPPARNARWCVGPLWAGSTAIGVLVLRFRRTGGLRQDEREFVAALATQCGQALERARLYAALSQSELQFRSVFDGALDAIALADDAGVLVDVNPAACALYGGPKEALIGRSMLDFFAEPRPREANAWWGSLLEKGALRGEAVLRDRAGVERRVEYSAVARIMPGRHVSILRDITERGRAQAALLEQSGRVDLLSRVGLSLTGELDLERLVQLLTGVITELAGAEFGIFQYASGAAEPQIVQAIAGEAPRAVPKLPSALTLAELGFSGPNLVRVGDLRAHEGTVPGWGMTERDGVRAYLAAPVTSRSGELLGCLMLGHSEAGAFEALHDEVVAGIASQAAVAIDNARLYRRAQDAIRARDEFLSVAAHELKTPLTSLKLQVQSLLRLPAALPEEARSTKLDAIHRQSTRLDKLISNLLDISRITSGRLELQLEPVDLSALLLDVSNRFAPELTKAGCSLTVNVPVPVVGQWDRSRVDQIVNNLLSNAVKYGAAAPIEIEAEAEGGNARIVVRDHGIGIDPNDQARIFQRFERAVSQRHYGGLGLGLWIVRQIVTAHGGAIEVESAPSRGSTFTVRLPLGEVQTSGEQA